jgi:hypothetical protein
VDGIAILYVKFFYVADSFMRMLMEAIRHELAEESFVQALVVPHSGSVATNLLFSAWKCSSIFPCVDMFAARQRHTLQNSTRGQSSLRSGALP